ncbi:unnamed protein product [Mytilus coruscus]|uniref:G-protein coupled receptors family 1 profile domain-containing protein n=1 Tax=Mytilus coruscus TaxID=42192 RepID=A0A6J8DBK2_MYTCO|nr:unnamed protein product [Mytilus coruscus]
MSSREPPYVNGSSSKPEKIKKAVLTLEKYFRGNLYIYYGKILPIISTFVILINVLLIITLIKGKFRKSTHAIMIAIATADSLTGFVSLPFNMYIFSLEKKTDHLTKAWCYIYEYMQKFLPEILHVSSLHLTVGLAIERFIVVAFPLKAHRKCKFKYGIIFSMIIFVVSICCQVDLFILVEFDQISLHLKRNNKTIKGCLRSQKVRSDLEYTLRIVFLVFIPCLILIIFTVLLLRSSKKIQQWRLAHCLKSQARRLQRMDQAVILMMIFIVVTEIIVQTSIIISRLYEIRFTTSNLELVGIGYIILQITCPINFSILCFLNTQFRDVFKKTFCRYVQNESLTKCCPNKKAQHKNTKQDNDQSNIDVKDQSSLPREKVHNDEMMFTHI